MAVTPLGAEAGDEANAKREAYMGGKPDDELVPHEPKTPLSRRLVITCARGLVVVVIEPAKKNGVHTTKIKLPKGWRWKSEPRA